MFSVEISSAAWGGSGRITILSGSAFLPESLSALISCDHHAGRVDDEARAQVTVPPAFALMSAGGKTRSPMVT